MLPRTTLLVAAVVAGALALAATSEADVLVNAIEPSTVACGKAVKPGIWYQSFSGGPRWARMKIKNNHGVVVWRKHAIATTTWHFWPFRGRCGSSYVLIYKTPEGTARFRFHIRRA
jgi:hypothetical protein